MYKLIHVKLTVEFVSIDEFNEESSSISKIFCLNRCPSEEENYYRGNMDKLTKSEEIRRANEYLDVREKMNSEFYATLIKGFRFSKIIDVYQE